MSDRIRHKAKIILLCMGAAVMYGVLHDQITVRLCLEYFTIAHPPVFGTTSPTLLAICWGTATTIGLGAVVGFMLASLSHAGTAPPLPWTALRRPLAWLLSTMAAAALLSGSAGYWLSLQGMITVPSAFSDLIPEPQHPRFMAAWFAHGASYLIGLSGTAFLVYRIWKARGRPSTFTFLPRSRAAMIRAGAVAVIAGYLVWRRLNAD
jgi:hypothetical protein